MSHASVARCLLRAGLLLLVGGSWMMPAAATQPRAWVVATYAYPQRDRAAAIRPLAEYLQRQSGRPVEVRVLPSPSALVEGLTQGQVDVAVPNLHGYLDALRREPALASLPVPDVPAHQADRYRAVILARQPLGEAELRRRAGDLVLVLVGRDSASGGFVPRHHLEALGLAPIDRAFARVDYAGSHAAALQALKDGRADVAALAADVRDADADAGLHEIWRSPPIPPGPLLCRPAMDLACDEIAAWLLRAGREDPRVMAGLRAGWPEFGDAVRLVGADPAAIRTQAGSID